MGNKKFIALMLVVIMAIFTLVGCTSGDTKESSENTQEDNLSQNTDVKSPPPEGKDTNNGRPYNLTPVKYDNRKDDYLNGINATILPVTDKPVTITIWRKFNSTIMKGLEESEAIKELEKRTGVHVEFMYPPNGQEADNFNIRVATNDLPDIFWFPPDYSGGYQKAVKDGVYVDLTPYYDKGLMPNLKWVCENNADVNKDVVADDGHRYFLPEINIVPKEPWPWTGLWVREDWLEELKLPLPKTISDWDNMLRAMKQAKGIAPLAFSIGYTYGMHTNYAFAGSYDVGYEFINKDGKAVYGPIDPGYREFLSKMHEWYSEKLIDQDFATRDPDSYFANISNGKIGAFGLAYGDAGQIKTTGQSKDPNFKITPVVQPTSYDGQIIHLRQHDSRVEGVKAFITTKAVDDGVDEIAVKWSDYLYSQDGGDLFSYGSEGVSYKWNDKGEVEWIYPRLKNNEGLDFWTIMPLFKVDNAPYLRDATAYEFAPEVKESVKVWSSQDAKWVLPLGISFTPEEATEFNSIMTEINTYRDEMTLKFITGQVPLSEFDNYVSKIKSLNIDRAIEIQQAALDRYLARK